MASDRMQRQIDRLLDEAEVAVERHEWELVRDRVQSVLALDPQNSDALAYLTAAERGIGNSGPPPSMEPTPTSSNIESTELSKTPTSFANGRYQVKRFLGEGGKKMVYLAHDTLLDRDVAFALIKTEGLDEASRTRIIREAQAMGRLGSHPHIVTVFDLGEHPSTSSVGPITQPYMVTELMGGGDVEGLVEDAPHHRVPLEQAITITRETCRGLEFAHSRGIVHRDLKPGNVWLTGDGVAKIGDFGLAVAIDRSRLTTAGMMVGTVSYMPPEQAMGGAVTPKSDLYSLGAMLYEMVTGRPPFLGDDSVAIIGQHINTPPVAPTWHNPQCPRALEALIMRLLAKDPAERPESAADVLAALDGVDLTVSVEIPQPDEAHALDSLAGGVFVGRQREMGELKACLEDALSGRGRLVTLVGEPGIGKTRTAQELATYAGLRSAQVLWGRCYEEQGMPPYWPWVQAIRSYVRERDPEELRSEMGGGAAEIAEVVSDVKERLPGLQPPPQLDSPEQSRFRLFDSIAAFLKTASQKQPLVLVLDDLHWADQPSLLLLQFVARELNGARLLVVGTYRDMELSRQHPLAESLGELTRERLFQRVLLRGLSQDDVGRFIEVVTGIAPPPGLTQAVYTQTEGNPLFVTEVVRLLVQEGELTGDRSGNRDSWTVRIPEGVREVIGRRLNRLSQRCNETLTIASVIGREFELRQLEPLVEDISEDRLLEVLEEALSARVIEELPQAVGRYQFTHALIQETLTQELSLTRRVRLHARIAEALEEIYGDNADAHAAQLAHHFAEAEAVLGPNKLVRYSLLAGEKSLASFAWEEAQSHFARGLAARNILLEGGGPLPDAEAAALVFGLARARAGTAERSQLQDAVDILERAFDYYMEVADADRAIAIAEYRMPGGANRIGMNRIIREALTVVVPDSLAEGRLLARFGFELGRTEGNDAAGQEAFSRALAIARDAGDAGLELNIITSSADLDWYQLRLEEAATKSLEAIERAVRAGETYNEAHARLTAVRALMMLGRGKAAESHASSLLAVGERLRDRYWQVWGLSYSSEMACLKGDWSQGRELALNTLQLSSRDNAPVMRLAILEYETGNFSKGEAYLDQLLELRVHANLNRGGSIDFFPALAIPYAARVSGMTFKLDEAAEIARSILSSPLAIPLYLLPARCALGLHSIIQSDAQAAAEQYEAMDGARGILIPFEMAGDRILGLLAHTMGNLDKATEHFDEALAFCRNAGYKPQLAWTCCDYADTLLQRNNPGDREQAMSRLDEALSISTELGMRPLMERVLSRRDILKA